MNLRDKDILELNELCGAVVDGTLTDAQRTRLTQILRESEAARRFYVRAVGQSASLHGYAAETHAEAPDRPRRGRAWHLGWWVAGGMAAAAALALTWNIRTRSEPGPRGNPKDDFVATVTATRGAEWNKGAFEPGAHLRKGQALDLRRGIVEITFDSGARVVVEGAATLDVNTAWDVTLRQGTLKASVPPEAVGFRVSNSAVDVVDLGTEFTMQAEEHGVADVFVLKGEVEAAPRRASDETILLREREARRFDGSGISDVTDRDKRFARFLQPLQLDRFVAKLGYVHWAFDETEGTLAQAESANLALSAAESGMSIFDAPDSGTLYVAGHEGQALRFDGRMYGRARVEGMSGPTAHTVAFWVRIGEDAQPIDTWMMAWGTSLPKLGGRPVQISWNRRPAEGALGAIRTDFGGGFAIGTTSLRDGKWHHIAVYFAPGDASDPAPLVKQYVDGKLESSTIVPGTLRAPANSGEMAVQDVIWLGYRLTGKQEGRRFRGEMDEVFITDRGLEPHEIVTLMRDNRPPAAALASR